MQEKNLYDLIQDVKFVVDELLPESHREYGPANWIDDPGDTSFISHPVVLESMEMAIEMILADETPDLDVILESDVITYILLLLCIRQTQDGLQLSCLKALHHLIINGPELTEVFFNYFTGPILLAVLQKKFLHGPAHVIAAFDCLGGLFSHQNMSHCAFLIPLVNTLIYYDNIIEVCRQYCVELMTYITSTPSDSNAIDDKSGGDNGDSTMNDDIDGNTTTPTTTDEHGNPEQSTTSGKSSGKGNGKAGGTAIANYVSELLPLLNAGGHREKPTESSILMLHSVLQCLASISTVFEQYYDRQAAATIQIVMTFYEFIVLKQPSPFEKWYPLCIDPLLEIIFNVIAQYAELDQSLGLDLAQRLASDRVFRSLITDKFLIQLGLTLIKKPSSENLLLIVSTFRYLSTTAMLVPLVQQAQIREYFILQIMKDLLTPSEPYIYIDDSYALLEMLGLFTNVTKAELEEPQHGDIPSIPFGELYLNMIMTPIQQQYDELQAVSAGSCASVLSSMLPYFEVHYREWSSNELLKNFQYFFSRASIDCDFFLLTNPLITTFQGGCIRQRYRVLSRVIRPIIDIYTTNGDYSALCGIIQIVIYFLNLSSISYACSLNQDGAFNLIETTQHKRDAMVLPPVLSSTHPYPIAVPSWYTEFSGEPLLPPPPAPLVSVGLVATTYDAFQQVMKTSPDLIFSENADGPSLLHAEPDTGANNGTNHDDDGDNEEPEQGLPTHIAIAKQNYKYLSLIIDQIPPQLFHDSIASMIANQSNQ